MKKSMKKFLIALILLLAIIGLSTSVQAATITETTNPNDKYDTIESGTTIIGTTKFTPDTIITGVKAATAGANDMGVYMTVNGDRQDYVYPNMYYYLEGDWYQFDIEGKLTYIEEIDSLDIYYVNNEAKEGITFPTKPEEPVNYSVYFTDETENYKTQTVLEGNTATKPTNPTREGYTFAGWYLDGVLFDFSTEITSDTVLVAKWEAKEVTPSYTVTFMNGSVVSETKTVEEGNTATKPTNPTREGYTFAGWYLDGVLFDFSTEITSDTVLVAKWEAKEVTPSYTVTFMNGSVVSETKTVEEGKTVAKPTNPTKEGYTFIGWYLDGTAFDFSTKITSNTILTAEWQEVEKTPTYKVTFVNGSNVYKTETIEEGSVVTEPTDPTKEGYTFVGWYQDDTAFNFSTKITSDTVLVAEWKYTTAIVNNQGELEDAIANQEITTIKIGQNFEVDKSIVISRELVIDGQDNTITKSGTPTYVSGGDNYIFKIYPGMADSEVIVKNIALTNSMGAIIVGPNTKATVDHVDLTGNVWGGIEVSGKTSLVATNLTMTDEAYAKPVVWVNTKPIDDPTITFEGSEKIRYQENSKDEYHYYTKFCTVTFKDGDTTVETQKVVYQQKATQLAVNPTKEHYDFDYWYLTDESQEFDFDTPISTNIILKAKYTPINYTIAFEDSGNTINGNYNDKVTITFDDPSSYEENGYTYVFAGWSDGKGNLYKKGDSITVTGNATYTKTWKAQKKANTLEELNTLLITEDSTLDEIVVAAPITINEGTAEDPVELDLSQSEKPVVIEETITNNGNLKLNLGDQTATTEKTIVNNGTLTLEGTTGTIVTSEDAGSSVHAIKNMKSATLTIDGGTYDASTHASATVYNAGGKVTIEDGTFRRSNENGSNAYDNGGNSYYLIDNYGEMTINGGDFEFDGEYSSLIHNGYQNYATQYTQNKLGIANPTMIINGGRFAGGLNTIKNDDGGIMTINDGEFISYSQQALLNWNVATINGGKFNGTNGDTCIYNSWGDDTIDKGQLNITGGEFIAPNRGYAIYQAGANASLTISNTTSEPVFKDYDGSTLAENRISNKAFTDERK